MPIPSPRKNTTRRGGVAAGGVIVLVGAGAVDVPVGTGGGGVVSGGVVVVASFVEHDARRARRSVAAKERGAMSVIASASTTLVDGAPRTPRNFHATRSGVT
jgi:hypothetical protein